MYVIVADICVILLGESSISRSHGLRQFPSRHQPASLQHSRLKSGCDRLWRALVIWTPCSQWQSRQNEDSGNLGKMRTVAISAK